MEETVFQAFSRNLSLLAKNKNLLVKDLPLDKKKVLEEVIVTVTSPQTLKESKTFEGAISSFFPLSDKAIPGSIEGYFLGCRGGDKACFLNRDEKVITENREKSLFGAFCFVAFCFLLFAGGYILFH
jgi:hypothetical protein